MGLQRDVIISIYYMSNGLTFEIRYIILQNFQSRRDSFDKFHENLLELTEKSAKNMRSWLTRFNVTLGIGLINHKRVQSVLLITGLITVIRNKTCV